MPVQQLFQDALALGPEDRAKLADLLWESLDPADQDIDRLWVEEIDRRIVAYRAGELETVSADDALAMPELPQWHKDELDGRLAVKEDDPVVGSSWEDVKARLGGGAAGTS